MISGEVWLLLMLRKTHVEGPLNGDNDSRRETWSLTHPSRLEATHQDWKRPFFALTSDPLGVTGLTVTSTKRNGHHDKWSTDEQTAIYFH